MYKSIYITSAQVDYFNDVDVAIAKRMYLSQGKGKGATIVWVIKMKCQAPHRRLEHLRHLFSVPAHASCEILDKDEVEMWLGMQIKYLSNVRYTL